MLCSVRLGVRVLSMRALLGAAPIAMPYEQQISIRAEVELQRQKLAAAQAALAEGRSDRVLLAEQAKKSESSHAKL